MRAERRRLWKAVAVLALVGVGVTGCGSSDKKDEATKSNTGVESQQQGGSGNGRVLIILDEAGHVASVDPKTGDRREIADVLVIPGGRAVSSSGLALFQAKGKENEDGEEEEPDGRLVIIDASSGKATPTIALKSAGGEYGDGAGEPEGLPIALAMREAGGGKRFVMIATSAGTLLANLKERRAIELTKVLGGKGEPGPSAKLSPDEQWGIITLEDKGMVLFSTDDPAKHRVIDGRSLGFSSNSKLLFVYDITEGRPGKVWAQPVDGGDPIVYAEGDVEFRGMVGSSVVVAEPNALYLSSRPGDRRPLDIPYNREEEDEDKYVIPIGSGGRGLMFSGDRDDRRWALVDEGDGKITPLPALDKLSLLDPFEERVVFGGGFNQNNVPSNYAVLEVAAGNVTPLATWDSTGKTGGQPLPSTDGRSVAISYAREDDLVSRTAIFKAGEGVVELDGSVTAWAPDGSAVILGRLVDDKPHMFVVDLATKKETDLGEGFGAVWTLG